MRRVDRSQANKPTILDDHYRDSGSELERNIETFKQGVQPGQKKVKFKFDRYSHDHVKKTLEAIFHGKCAYCESFYAKTQPVDVEHYRPKGQVAGEGHGGYWWLAADWDNLLPSCIDCNRKRKQELPPLDEAKIKDIWGTLSEKPIQMGKMDSFPIRPGHPRARFDDDDAERRRQLDLEDRLLLDPTRDDPSHHISFNVGRNDIYSLVLPWNAAGEKSDKGLLSIRIYGLNRLRLVQARKRVLMDLQFLFKIFVTLKELQIEVDVKRADFQARLDNWDGVQAELEEQYQSDLAFIASVSSTVKRVSDDLLEKIVGMTVPEAEFSMLAKAWIAQHIEAVVD